MMSNFSLNISHINGDLTPKIDMGKSSKDIVEAFIGDDHGAPAMFLTICIKTESGKDVTVTVPYDDCELTSVRVDGEMI